MKKYLRIRVVSAEPMTANEYTDFCAKENYVPMASLVDDEKGYKIEYDNGATEWVDEDVFQKEFHRAVKLNEIENGDKGVYVDGYERWLPAYAFEKAYKKIDGLTFGGAIEALKNGKKVSRKGWNGKGMYLWLKQEVVVKKEWCRDERLIDCINANGGEEILALGTICMYTHDSTGRNAVLTGWLASQSDMLATDWEIVDEEDVCANECSAVNE
jgi:hypothetical protein